MDDIDLTIKEIQRSIFQLGSGRGAGPVDSAVPDEDPRTGSR